MSGQQLHVAERLATYEVIKQIEAKTWPTVPLSEAVDINPKADRSLLTDDTEVTFVPMAAVEAASGRVDTSTVRRYEKVKKGYTHFRDGDVLFAKITPCMENGKMAVTHGLRNGVGLGSTEFHVLRPRKGVDPHYVYHFVSSTRYRSEAAHHMTGAVGQKRVPLSFLEQSQIPLPELDEQRRIVAEIEKQFSRLDEAVAGLKRVKANLKRYKAAILKAAVEGRLVPTEGDLARREGRNYETGAQLLQRILDSRRSQWQGKGKYKEPVAPDTTNLPELPEGWAWASAMQACDPVVDCHNKTAPYTDSGIPLVRTTNIRDGRLLLDDVRFVDQPTYEFWSRRCPPEPGDVLFTREAPMGEAGIIPRGVRLCLGQRTMLMRPSPAISSSFLLTALLSPVVKALIERVAVGSGVKHLRVGDVELLPIPLPPLAEQHRIVAEVDRQVSLVSEVGLDVEVNLSRGKLLKESVLDLMFRSQ
ncbi:MAG: restriction endonuclease subunit S [Pseudomonadota bacterium]